MTATRPSFRAALLIATALVSIPGLHSADAQSLNRKEKRRAWISPANGAAGREVTRGADGKVIFLYGEVQPSVVCSPLQVCDIELQGGEVVRDVLVGDTVRWKVEPGTSGATGGQAIHLIVKPAEPGLVTSMVVTTSRRTYHIQLEVAPDPVHGARRLRLSRGRVLAPGRRQRPDRGGWRRRAGGAAELQLFGLRQRGLAADPGL